MADHPQDSAPGTGIPNATLDREIEVVRSAIDAVAYGVAPRVTIAGLHFGEDVARLAREWTRDRGVVVQPLWSADEAGADLLVEPRRDPASGAR